MKIVTIDKLSIKPHNIHKLPPHFSLKPPAVAASPRFLSRFVSRASSTRPKVPSPRKSSTWGDAEDGKAMAVSDGH